MLQLEINLCFFAFYELVPDWEEDNTHNGPGEEQKQSQSGKCQYPDWGITWFITQLWLWLVLPPIGDWLATLTPHWSHWASLEICALQTMNNPLCTLVQRSPHTRLCPFHQFFELFVLIMNTEQCLFWLQQPPCYFPHLDLISHSICPDYFCRTKRFR